MTYRVGIWGSGFGGMVHAPAYKAHPAFELVAIASPKTAAAVAKERGIPHAFTSLEAMLDGVELDLVSIASPPFDHREAVLLALARGKHLLCEKPLATRVSDAEEMAAAARAAGVVAGMSHEFRFTPSRIAIKELVENGHLGPLREIEIADLRTILRADVERPDGWWFSKAGGPAQALVSHLIDNANWLAGRPPQRVCGFMRTANPVRRFKGETFTTEIGDGVFALLDYGEGLVGRITCDCTVAHTSHLLAVHGETMTALASGPSIPQTTTFVVDESETSELELRPSPYAKYGAVNVNIPLFMELLDELAKALNGAPNALPTLQEALETQRVLEAIGYRA